MNNIIKSIEDRLNHYHDLLYTSPSDFKHVSAKSDMRYLLKEIENLQEENDRLNEINKGLLGKRTDLELETFRLKDERKMLQEDNDHQREVKIHYRDKIWRLERSLKEIKSISSMWDVRHSEDVTGYSTILELSRKALEQSK
jgi:predicted RNase H-like nuclease (RuvC/YqgF family)